MCGDSPLSGRPIPGRACSGRAIWYNARKEYRRDRIPRKEDNMEYRVLPHGGEKVSAIGTQPEEFAAMITDRLQLELRNN